MYVGVLPVCTSHREQKSVLSPLKVKLEQLLAVVEILGTDPESSARTVSAPNRSASSSPQTFLFSLEYVWATWGLQLGRLPAVAWLLCLIVMVFIKPRRLWTCSEVQSKSQCLSTPCRTDSYIILTHFRPFRGPQWHAFTYRTLYRLFRKRVHCCCSTSMKLVCSAA